MCPEFTAAISQDGDLLGRPVWLVVACTRRKSQPPSPGLRARSLTPGSSVSGRAAEWLRRLATDPSERVPARDLYRGDQWRIALSLDRSPGPRTGVAVISGGYGLVFPDQGLKPYSATFAAGPDSVVSPTGPSRDAQLREWWEHLTRVQAPNGRPSSLRELAAVSPEATLVALISEPYLAAIQDDLKAAKRQLRSLGQLVVVSSAANLHGFDDHAVRVGADLQAALGGAMTSLYARVARHLVELSDEHRWDIGSIRRLLKALPRASSVRTVPGARMTGPELLAFIRRARASQPTSSATALLRQLRDSGRACEQARFAALFEQATS